MSFDKVYDVKAIVPARVRIEENHFDKSLGILFFDKDNGYPNRMRMYVNASGTGKPVVEMFGTYCNGNGFRDLRLAKLKVNKKGQTCDDILAAVADDMAYHYGFYIHVNYNALYEIVSFKVIPFENVRYAIPDEGSQTVTRVAVYDDWAKKKSDKMAIRPDDVEFLYLYDPRPEVIQRQVEKAGGWNKYKGQVYCNPLGYCLPLYDCVQEELLTDAGIKTFKLSTIESGFAASFIYVHKGKKPAKTKDGDYNNSVEEQLELFQDPETGGAIFVVYAEKPDQEPKLIPVKKDYDDRLYNTVRKTTKDDIIGALLIPPVLLLQTPGKLGGPEYNEAVDIYNTQTAKHRLRIERAFEELFARSIYISPDPQKPYEFTIDPVGGVQTGLGIKESLIAQYIALMGNAGIDPESKYWTLVEIFGLDKGIATRLSKFNPDKPNPEGNGNDAPVN